MIGLGRWGPNHVRNFQALKVCVVAAADTDAACRARIKALYPTVAIEEDYRCILTRNDVDAVVVATPTGTHYKIVRHALEAGKHVLCEKPLATKGRDAWELVSLAEKKRLHLMVGHVFLFNPGIEYLAESLQEKVAGEVYYISAIHTNLGPFRYDVNAAWDLASHDIYIFNHFLRQRPIAVAAAGGHYLQKKLEDIVFMTLHYPNGVLGHIHVSWLDPKKVRQITVVGEKKMITWDDLGVPGPVMIYDRSVVKEPRYNSFGEFQLLAREGDVVMPRVPSQEPLTAQACAFLKLIAESNDPGGRGSSRQGAEVVDILEAASRSLASEGRKTEVTYGE